MKLSLILVLTLFASPLFAHGGHEGDVHPPHDVAAEGAPSLSNFRIEKAENGKHRLSVEVRNFTFGDTENGHSGHAHLYINGSKLGQVHSATWDLPDIPYGPHDFRLVLVTADHSEFAIAGRAIETRLTFTVE